MRPERVSSGAPSQNANDNNKISSQGQRMTVLLVICDIKDEQRCSKLHGTLKKRFRNTVKLSESTFAVYTSLLPIRIFDELKQHVGIDDQLYVIPLRKPYTGYGPRRTTEWLSDYLPT